MIMTFADDETRIVFDGRRSKKLPSEIQEVARRKLRYLDGATVVTDLRIPPSNMLEKLVGNRNGQWSIRINDKWRVCFSWKERTPDPQSKAPQPGDAYDVEITNHYR